MVKRKTVATALTIQLLIGQEQVHGGAAQYFERGGQPRRAASHRAAAARP
jgi:hypothetical protein